MRWLDREVKRGGGGGRVGGRRVNSSSTAVARSGAATRSRVPRARVRCSLLRVRTQRQPGLRTSQVHSCSLKAEAGHMPMQWHGRRPGPRSRGARRGGLVKAAGPCWQRGRLGSFGARIFCSWESGHRWTWTWTCSASAGVSGGRPWIFGRGSKEEDDPAQPREVEARRRDS